MLKGLLYLVLIFKCIDSQTLSFEDYDDTLSGFNPEISDITSEASDQPIVQPEYQPNVNFDLIPNLSERVSKNKKILDDLADHKQIEYYRRPRLIPVIAETNNGTAGHVGYSDLSIDLFRDYCANQIRGQVASPNSCRRFINCWDGNAIEQQCPQGLVFSIEKENCDFPENVDCGSRPNNPIPVNSCEIPNGYYRNPLNCSEFFICVQTTPVKFSCPEETLFNDVIGVCDFPYRVKCNNTTPIANITTNNETNVPSSTEIIPGIVKSNKPCSGSGISYVSLNEDCTQVTVCIYNYSKTITCLESTAFDAKAFKCIDKNHAKC